jgi:hypothetical protein
MTATLPLFNPLGDLLHQAPAMPVTVEEPLAPEGHRPRRRWTADEDARLIAAVNKYGSQRGPGSQWSKISAGLPGRTNKVSRAHCCRCEMGSEGMRAAGDGDFGGLCVPNRHRHVHTMRQPHSLHPSSHACFIVPSLALLHLC